MPTNENKQAEQEKCLLFHFSETTHHFKFDDLPYYRRYADVQPFGKGVDIVAYDDERFVLLEIKDFHGYESDPDCIARLMTNRVVHLVTDSPVGDLEGKLPLCQEIPAKIVSTLAAIFGGKISQDHDMMQLFTQLQRSRYRERTVDIVLFLGGDIEKMIALKGHNKSLTHFKAAMEHSLRRQLSWLTDRIVVRTENSVTKRDLYSVVRIS